MTDTTTPDLIYTLATRFCQWPLPMDFAPDGGCTFTPPSHPNHPWPCGTNLLTVAQAETMLRFVLDDAAVTGGWIVGNANADQWRSWSALGPCWTSDRDKATRFARREDAEAVHAEDEDAWRVELYAAPSQATMPDLIEKVHWAIRKTIVGHADQPMDVALMDGLECDPNDDAMGSAYEAFDRCAQAAIAALADQQSAPTCKPSLQVAPSTDTPDEFIAEALRLAEWTPDAEMIRYARQGGGWSETLAHAKTLHKLAEVERERDRLRVKCEQATTLGMEYSKDAKALTAKLAVAHDWLNEALVTNNLPYLREWQDKVRAQIGDAG